MGKLLERTHDVLPSGLLEDEGTVKPDQTQRMAVRNDKRCNWCIHRPNTLLTDQGTERNQRLEVACALEGHVTYDIAFMVLVSRKPP